MDLILYHSALLYFFLCLKCSSCSEAYEDPKKSYTIILTPSDDSLVVGVGETLTLTCTVLPVAIESESNGTTDDASLLRHLMESELMRNTKNDEDTFSNNDDNPKPHWTIPVNEPERVTKTHLPSSINGVVSIRVSVHRIKENDSGQFTCTLGDEGQYSASVQVTVQHRDVVQHCSLSTFQCSTGECIPMRFVCDSKPDCPSGTDELNSQCGPSVCLNKLVCEDGRCMDPRRCCRPSKNSEESVGGHKANCSINAAVRCCRQLLHPADLNQDLYYLATQPKPRGSDGGGRTNYSSPFLIGAVVAVANITTVCMVLLLHYRVCGAGSRGHRPQGSHAWWTGDVPLPPHCYDDNPFGRWGWLYRRRRFYRSPSTNIIALSSLREDCLYRSSAPLYFSSTPPPSYQQAIRDIPPSYYDETESVSRSSQSSSLFTPVSIPATHRPTVFVVSGNSSSDNSSSTRTVSRSGRKDDRKPKRSNRSSKLSEQIVNPQNTNSEVASGSSQPLLDSVVGHPSVETLAKNNQSESDPSLKSEENSKSSS